MNKSIAYFTSFTFFKSGKTELESLFLSRGFYFHFLSGMLRIQTTISPRDWTWHTYRQGSVELAWRVVYFRTTENNTLPLTENHKKYFLLSKTLKNTVIKQDSFGENSGQYGNNQELCYLKYLVNKSRPQNTV